MFIAPHQLLGTPGFSAADPLRFNLVALLPVGTPSHSTADFWFKEVNSPPGMIGSTGSTHQAHLDVAIAGHLFEFAELVLWRSQRAWEVLGAVIEPGLAAWRVFGA